MRQRAATAAAIRTQAASIDAIQGQSGIPPMSDLECSCQDIETNSQAKLPYQPQNRSTSSPEARSDQRRIAGGNRSVRIVTSMWRRCIVQYGRLR